MTTQADKGECSEAPTSQSEMEALCFRNLLNNPDERIYFKDRASRFLLVSQGWANAVTPGHPPEEFVGKTDFDIFTELHAADAFEDEQRIMRTGEPIVGKHERETYEDRPDQWVATTKQPLYDRDGRVVGTFGISRDVTAQVKAEEALAYQALHDPLTGLANRVSLMDRISRALVALERRPGRLAVLFIDLDNFKAINDAMGHDTGDKVLVEVSRRLCRIARRVDTVARFGGDEFVVLCSDIGDDEDPRLIADRLIRTVGQPFVDAGRDLSVTCSIGFVVASDPSADPGQLLRDADVAMYGAKELGGNRFQVFVPSQRRPMATLGAEMELRRALDNSELFLVYQPLFGIEDRSLRGAEALVRWRHPTRGVLLPAEFIPLAEQRGLISEVGTFVFEEACRQLASWSEKESWAKDFTMAVNVSGRQLTDPGLPERISLAMARHGLDPARLCLEITETALIGEIGGVQENLTKVSALGVRLALDDFGTGYSTLAHLQNLRVDILKIDRSFVEQLGGTGRGREIVGAVTAMSHALGMTVVGEGIETAAQFDELAALACDEGQGYLLARPLAPDRLAEFGRAAQRGTAKARHGRGTRGGPKLPRAVAANLAR